MGYFLQENLNSLFYYFPNLNPPTNKGEGSHYELCIYLCRFSVINLLCNLRQISLWKANQRWLCISEDKDTNDDDDNDTNC